VARDDWRIRVELEEERADNLLERLTHADARELAEELRGHRLAVSREDDTVFVYTETRDQARRAQDVVEAELAEEEMEARTIRIEHWLGDEDRWDDDPPAPTVEEEVLQRGYAPWEVRVELESHEQAAQLADRLEAEGYSVVRRWRYVLAGTASREEADALARRVHGEVEAGSELVWEVVPRNPFAVFGGLGG
jgi:hypothetical protein